MEIGTLPTRWRSGTQNKHFELEREERASRTNVVLLDYDGSGKARAMPVTTHHELRNILKDPNDSWFRLFIVEDLSRDVIDVLGSHLDIEPDFFRDHIYDGGQYDISDKNIVLPDLSVDAKRQHRIQIQFVMVRQFETKHSFELGRQEAESFNISRKLEYDQSGSVNEKVVGTIRANASLWFSSAVKTEDPVVGKRLLVK